MPGHDETRHCEEPTGPAFGGPDDKLRDEAIHPSSFRDGPKDQTSDVQLHIGESQDSGFARLTRARNDISIAEPNGITFPLSFSPC